MLGPDKTKCLICPADSTDSLAISPSADDSDGGAAALSPRRGFARPLGALEKKSASRAAERPAVPNHPHLVFSVNAAVSRNSSTRLVASSTVQPITLIQRFSAGASDGAARTVKPAGRAGFVSAGCLARGPPATEVIRSAALSCAAVRLPLQPLSHRDGAVQHRRREALHSHRVPGTSSSLEGIVPARRLHLDRFGLDR